LIDEWGSVASMTFIEVIGNVTEDGKLDAQLPAGVPPGPVNITVWIESEEDIADRAKWDHSFSQSQEMLLRMAKEALEEDAAGLTMDFDPDIDLEKHS
jgi:hypothetical protein